MHCIVNIFNYFFKLGLGISLFASCQSTSLLSSNPENYKQVLNQPIDTIVRIPPAWAFGVLYGGYTDQKQSLQTIEEIMAHEYPIDAYWIDSWFWSYKDKGSGPKKYIDFIADSVSYPDRKAMWNFMQERHIKGGFWVWDCIQENGNETVYRAFDSLGYFSSKYLNTNPWHNNSSTTAMFESGTTARKGTWCGNIDFQNPEAVAYFKEKMKPFFDEGADFVKLDRTSDLHTVKAVFEMSQEWGLESKGRGFTLSHSGDTNNPDYKRYPTKWTDDTRSDWNMSHPTKVFNDWVPKVAFKENIHLYTDPILPTSNIPYLTNDTGGFDMGITEFPDEELYIRWVQFSTFTPIMEVFSQPENPTRNLAYKYSKQADSIFKTYTHLRMKLFPYLYSYALAVRIEGKKMIQPLRDEKEVYYFGNELLVAPVFEKQGRMRSIDLPKGFWTNFLTSEKYVGGKMVDVKAPLDQIPLLVKSGSIIPMRDYQPQIEVGSNEKIILHVFPGEDTVFKLYEDDGMSNDYLENAITLTEIQLKQIDKEHFKISILPSKGDFVGFNEHRIWQFVIHAQENYTLIFNNLEILPKTEEGTRIYSLPMVSSRTLTECFFTEIN